MSPKSSHTESSFSAKTSLSAMPWPFRIENDIGCNILKNDKNLYNCWREFKSFLQRDFQTLSKFSRRNALQPSVNRWSDNRSEAQVERIS